MGYTTIRISESARDTLKRLSAQAGRPMQSLLEEAVETLRRKRFLEQVNSAYERLRADPGKWKGVEAERRAWDETLADGLAVADGARQRPPRKRKSAG